MIIASLPKVFIQIGAAVSFISILGLKRGITVSNKKPSVLRDEGNWIEKKERDGGKNKVERKDSIERGKGRETRQGKASGIEKGRKWRQRRVERKRDKGE